MMGVPFCSREEDDFYCLHAVQCTFTVTNQINPIKISKPIAWGFRGEQAFHVEGRGACNIAELYLLVAPSIRSIAVRAEIPWLPHKW